MDGSSPSTSGTPVVTNYNNGSCQYVTTHATPKRRVDNDVLYPHHHSFQLLDTASFLRTCTVCSLSVVVYDLSLLIRNALDFYLMTFIRTYVLQVNVMSFDLWSTRHWQRISPTISLPSRLIVQHYIYKLHSSPRTCITNYSQVQI